MRPEAAAQGAQLDLGWPPPAQRLGQRQPGAAYPHADARTSAEHHMAESESVHRANQRLDHATTVGGVCGALPRQHLQLFALLRALPALTGQLKRSRRQSYKAGEKCFIDYAGQTVPIVDPACIFRPNVFT